MLAEALDPPPQAQVAAAMRTLRELGAIETDKATQKSKLTALGNKLCQLHIEPRLGKMLVLASALRCLKPALAVAAAREAKDPFVPNSNADFARASLGEGLYSDQLLGAAICR